MFATGIVLLALCWVYVRLRRDHLALVSLNTVFFDRWDWLLVFGTLVGGGLCVASIATFAWAYLP